MSFFKNLMGKDKEKEKGEEAARPNPKQKSGNNQLDAEAAAYIQQRRKAKLPTQEQREFFNATRAKQKRIGQALVNQGLINEEMLKETLGKLNSEAGTTLQQSLVEQQFVREEDVLDALATELGMDRISLADQDITPDLVEVVPKKVAKEYRVFPVEADETEVVIAIADPLNIQVIDDLQRIVGRPVRTVIAPEEEIDRFYNRFYEGDELQNVYEKIVDEAVQKDMDAAQEQTIELEDNEQAPPVVRFVDLVFKQAVHERASDIHIEPTRFGLVIRFRVDGVLHEVPSPPKKWQNAIISRLKVLSGMDLAEKRVPQDGRIKLSLPDRKLDLRVNSLPSIYGETIVMRILDQSSVLLGLEDVGFLPDNISLFNSLIRSPTGVILMTGPTGSGKTTTLYSALSTLNSPEVKIVTIENPVEYMLEGVVQVQVMEDVGLDFTTGLRSILRQSPDVLLVGEMRDLETAEIGIRAALTGHLVFSTLHTNDAPSAPGRLSDMGVKPFLVASALQAVIAQRLVRRLCSSCKTNFVPDESDLLELGATEEEMANIEEYDINKPVGCDRCSGKGFRGRTAIHEIFVLDARLRQMIIKGESAMRLKKVAARSGMRTLRMDGWEKVKLGNTSPEEILRITQND